MLWAFGTIIGFIQVYNDFKATQEQLEVFGLGALHLGFFLILGTSLFAVIPLIYKVQKLSKSPLSQEAREHHRAIIDFIAGIGTVNLLPAGTFRITHLNAFGKGGEDIPGGKVNNVNGQILVYLSAETKPQWVLAKQHLKRDKLWKLLDEWKLSAEHEIASRLVLFRVVRDEISAQTGLPIARNRGLDEFVAEELPAIIYERIFGVIAGRSNNDNINAHLQPTLIDTDHVFIKGGVLLAQCRDSDKRAKIENLYRYGHEEFGSIPQVTDLEEAYRKAVAINQCVHLYIEDFAQSTALPRNSRCHRCPD